MKRFLTLFLSVLLFAAGCSKNDPASKPGRPVEPKDPKVTTTAVSEYGKTTAVLGGTVADAELSTLTQVGVQYIAWSVAEGGEPAWGTALVGTAEKVADKWSITVKDLLPATDYAVRAYVRTASKEFYGAVATFATDPLDVAPPVVRTAEAAEVDAVSALLGGSVVGVEISTLTEVGTQYMVWKDNAGAEELDWSKAVELAGTVAATWSARAENLESETKYGARAYVGVEGRRYYGEVKSFTTWIPAEGPLTVAQLRAKYTSGEDVSGKLVGGYVALSIPDGTLTESFESGTVILYDNTGSVGSAIALSFDDTATGMDSAGLREGDYVMVVLATVKRYETNSLYGRIPAAAVRIFSRDHRIDPVWVTPAQLAADANPYICSPVKLSRVYAETPGVLFSKADNWFTDGEARFEVYAKAGSTVGQLTQNSATGTLSGICWNSGKTQIVPVKAGDVAAFTGDDGVTEGTPGLELGKEYYEFAPQGGTLVVNCKVTRTAKLRLFADTRFFDTQRYSVDIEGERVTITARANTTGVTSDYTNVYLYLAETKDGQRISPVTVKVTQLSSVYESIPSLIAANGGKLSSVHDAEVNGFATSAMKLGSGSYTGYYTSDPLSAPGTCKLVFYVVGWSEGGHTAGTLYLRVENGGSASVTSIPLKVNP